MAQLVRPETSKRPVFARMGVGPVINACGIYTDLGGSRLSPAVVAAMEEVNGSFVRMTELLESSGGLLAGHFGAEAGLVTPGAAASIALMVSAAMTGIDGAASERLPDTAGLRDEIVLQRNHRYKYDRQITMTGARLTLAGTEHGTTTAEIEATIGPKTAALFLPAHLDWAPGTVPLAELARVGQAHGIPLLVDAAYLCWPLDVMPTFTRAGADLVCFSAKYFGGPNAGGFMVGTGRLIDAVKANDFTRYESGQYRTFGRPFKMDRQTVVAVVIAFEEWLGLDHGARWDRYAEMVRALGRAVESVPGVRAEAKYFTMDERLEPDPVNALVVSFVAGARWTPASVAQALATGSPAVACVVEEDRLVFCVDVMSDSEAVALAARLRAVLESG